MERIKKKYKFMLALLGILGMLSGCGDSLDALNLSAQNESVYQLSGVYKEDEQSVSVASIDEIPDYAGEPYVVINENVPDFKRGDLTTQSFEQYCELDSLGRCVGSAFANVGEDIMPTEERGSIGQVKPSGWHTVKYDNIDGKYLYNRCHLIGYQLTGENSNTQNLITGTRYLNVEGMLPFENMVADYVEETNNHVLYRVTPIYQGDNLLADGVEMEGYSVEDEGEGICFHVFVYNVQPGIVIDYATGESYLDEAEVSETPQETENTVGEIRGNANSMIYHCPGQAAYENMEDSKYLVVFQTEQEAIEAGYRKAKR